MKGNLGAQVRGNEGEGLLRDKRIRESWHVGVLRGVWESGLVEAACGYTEGGEGPEGEDGGGVLLRPFELGWDCEGQQA